MQRISYKFYKTCKVIFFKKFAQTLSHVAIVLEIFGTAILQEAF